MCSSLARMFTVTVVEAGLPCESRTVYMASAVPASLPARNRIAPLETKNSPSDGSERTSRSDDSEMSRSAGE